MRASSRTTTSVGALLLLLAVPARSVAQSPEELAKQTQNPIASLISVPFQGNWDFGLGDQQLTGTVLNFQPVVPFRISQTTNVIFRIIMPLMSQPGATDGTARINGLSDTVATAFFSPTKASRITWGIGPALLIPTATSNQIGTEKFGIGPSFVVLTQPGKWTLGLLANQIWSTSGAANRQDVNQTFIQPFVNYNLGGGLALGVSVEATGNWKADETWTTPMVFSISKIVMLGTSPMNLVMGAGPMVASPAAGASWRFRMAAVFLFPHKG